MAYREHGMWEVLEVLRRVHRGEPVRLVARATGRSRTTVRRYVAVAGELGWSPGEGGSEPGEELAGQVLARLRPGPREGEATAAQTALLPHEGQIRKWLETDCPGHRGLKLSKVHDLLARLGVVVSYMSLYRFVVRRLGFGRERGTVRVAATAPGELAEVDFGRLGRVPYPERGTDRVLYALIVTLVFSRHMYVYLTHSQKVGDLIAGLESAWAFFGGATARVVVDNLKAAVVKADRYEPAFQRTFEEYARHRGFVIDAAVPREPKGKPHVERQVQYVRESFFRGEVFLSREHAQSAADRWCLEKAGTRVHGTTRERPLFAFEERERVALIPLSSERFDPPSWAEVTVHPDCHVRFGNALYSVPYAHRGKKATVRGDHSLVRVYVEGNHVKTHPVHPPGGRSTDPADYPPEKAGYAMRDADALIRKAQEVGEAAGRFAEKLLSGTFPWSKLRQAQKLLRLSDKYGASRLDAACSRALAFDLVDVRRVEAIVVKGLAGEGMPAGDGAGLRGVVVPMPARFLRDTESFRHEPAREE